MCKEDIRINRRTASRTVTVADTSVVGTVIFPPNADRIGVLVGFKEASLILGTTTCCVGTPQGDSYAPIAGIGPSRPVDRARIEDVGDPIRGSLVISKSAGSATGIDVTEVFFTEALNDL